MLGVNLSFIWGTLALFCFGFCLLLVIGSSYVISSCVVPSFSIWFVISPEGQRHCLNWALKCWQEALRRGDLSSVFASWSVEQRSHTNLVDSEMQHFASSEIMILVSWCWLGNALRTQKSGSHRSQSALMPGVLRELLNLHTVRNWL